MCLLLPIRPNQGVYLGHVSVIELLHSWCDLGLFSLDIHREYQCVVFCFLADLVVRGSLMVA